MTEQTKQKLNKLLGIAMIFFCLFGITGIANATTIFTDDFNSYTDGDLNGQGSWSGDAHYDIQGVTTFEGTKAVKLVTYDTGSTPISVAKTGTARTDGQITVNFNWSDNTTGDWTLYPIHLFQGGTEMGIIMISAGKIYIWDQGSAWVQFGTQSASVWKNIIVQWRSSDSTYRASYDGGSYSNWVALRSAISGGLDIFKFTFNSWTSTASNLYLDYIAENPYSAPSAAALRVNRSQVIE